MYRSDSDSRQWTRRKTATRTLSGSRTQELASRLRTCSVAFVHVGLKDVKFRQPFRLRATRPAHFFGLSKVGDMEMCARSVHPLASRAMSMGGSTSRFKFLVPRTESLCMCRDPLRSRLWITRDNARGRKLAVGLETTGKNEDFDRSNDTICSASSPPICSINNPT